MLKILNMEYRQFACNKCGAIQEARTNHQGSIYGIKCKNWLCTPGCFDFTSATYWNGETELKETSYYANNNYTDKVKLLFKKGV